MDEYKKMRDYGEPIDAITIALRLDDVDTFQSIVSKSNIEISEGIVPYNIFECISTNGETSYINYAAFYGSIKCFKYLLLNHAEINESTFKCALFGGNIEIIKIVDQNMNNYSKQEFDIDDIVPVIQKHQNQIFDWIFEQKISNKNFNTSLIKTSVASGNAYSLIQIIDKDANISSSSVELWKNQIQDAAQRGFYKIIQLLYQILIHTNKEQSNIRIYSYWSNIKSIDIDDDLREYSVSFGNLNILKFYFKFLNYGQKELRVSLLLSIEKNYFKIIKYFFENLINEGFDVTNEIALECLSLSVKKKTNEIFFYLIEQIKKIDPTIFKNFKWYSELLSISCHYKNLEAVKNITELVLENDIKNDFTMAFYNAIIYKSIEICKYFIDKKVFIDYEILSSQIPQISTSDVEFFDLILQNSTEYGKSNFLQFSLDYAIQNNNKNLIEFLLNKGIIFDNALINAVNTRDVDIVNLVLKYNSKPSFINKRSSNGTALSIAVELNNLPIVQRLLSLPGINPSLYSFNYNTPLKIAITNFRLDIIDVMLDFYGESIQSETWQLDEAMKDIFQYFSINMKSNDNLLEVLKRIINIKNINVNYHSGNYTLLSFACKNNGIDIVKTLLESGKVDVNLYCPDNGYTPLMIAIENQNIEIVKLLIEHPQVDINMRNYSNETALTIASLKNLENVVDLLINHKKFDPKESNIDYAFYLSNGEISKKLVQIESLDVNYNYFSQKTNNDKKNDKKKDEKSTDYFELNDTELVNETSLTLAVKKSNLELIDLIIQHHSFSKTKSQLKIAIINTTITDNVDLYDKLQNLNDNDINIHDFKFKSLFKNAINNVSVSIISRILNNPRFDSRKNNLLDTFIQFFVSHSNCDCNKEKYVKTIEMLYKYDIEHDHLIDLNQLLPNGKSFYTNFNFIKKPDIIQFLLLNGADPNIVDNNEMNSLTFAIKQYRTDISVALINSGKIDLTKKVVIREKFLKTTLTYLHLAAQLDNNIILNALLNRNEIDVNSTDDKGNTPFMLACQKGSIQNIEALIVQNNLDFLHKNIKGNDALSLINGRSVKTKYKEISKKEYFSLILEKLGQTSRIIIPDDHPN